MKRPLILILALAAAAVLLSQLVLWTSRAPSPDATEAPDGVAAVAPGPASPIASPASPREAADLAAPTVGATERVTAPDPSTEVAGPRVTVAGRVVPPSGGATDETVEVIDLDAEMSVDDVRRALHPANARGRSAPGATGAPAVVPVAGAGAKRILGRARMEADGRYRVEVPAER